MELSIRVIIYSLYMNYASCSSMQVMSTHASVLVDSVGPPSVEVCRIAASFP
jgi:hypothetical protein